MFAANTLGQLATGGLGDEITRMPETCGRRPAWEVELHAGYGLLTLAYMAVIYWFSSQPDLGVRRGEPLTALTVNLVHIPVYAGLAVCFLRALAGGRATQTPRAPSLLALLGAAGYGALDEWHQSFVPGRSASVGDFLLDLAGILGMLLLLQWGCFRVSEKQDMTRKVTKLLVFGVFCVALAVSEARAQAMTVTPASPVIAVGETQQFTARNLTPSLVSASGSHTCALLPDGTVRCWGYNEFGQLGDGTTTDSSTPVAVAGISTAIAAAAGHHHTCALLADGTLRCWGSNEFGQLGDGTTTDAATPVAVASITTAIAVTPGAHHTCALLADAAVWCWGDNDFGQLGDGSLASSPTPVMVTGLGTPTAVTAGAYHTCALLPDGAVRCWGRNDSGQLGDGDTPNSSTPVPVSGLASVTAISAGGHHTCARLSDGTLRCWGRNNFGQLGDGGSLTYLVSEGLQGPLYSSTLPPGSHSRTPVEVTGIRTATAVTAGGLHTCAVLSDGAAKCWGQNDYGELGDGTTTSSSTPVDVSGLPAGAVVSAGAWHTCALLPDSTVACWGRNFAGQLGNGTTSNSSTPRAVTGSGPVTWTSSDTAVATIDAATGLATAHNPGSTTITATANGASGSALLTAANRFSLSVVREGAGSGTVISSPAGISCGTDCSEAYLSGTAVTLTATADEGSTFEGWAGGGCTGPGTCVVTVTADTTVTAGFGAAPAPAP